MKLDRLVLCTGNAGKVEELRALLPPHILLISLTELGIPKDLPETGDTLEANAIEKARYVHSRTGLPCVADDSGLEVIALDGAPGVHSARYAGENNNADRNMARLLSELKGISDRTARFRTVLAFVYQDVQELFEGTVDGTIALHPKGTAGFGYDPIFIPSGGNRTFAEMSPEQKNGSSHRSRAVRKFIGRLGRAEPAL